MTEVSRPGYEWTVLSVTTIGVLMATMQSTALLIALPDLMGSLHMGLFTVMWVLLIYMLISTAMVPLFGRLADMYGRKKLYVLGFAVFTFGSLLCALATSSYQGYDLIIYRIVQALGGALMAANGTPMVTDAFRANRLGLGLGINGIAGGAGLVLGPVIGGVLAPYGWQWIFLYNVPFGILGTIWAYTRLREPVDVPRSPGFDWWGCATFLVCMTSLLLAISLYSFPVGLGMDLIYALFALGALGIVGFLLLELRVRTPMLDLHLFRNPDFAIGCTTTFLNSLTRGAMLFLLIFFLQGPYGQDPLTAGLSLIPLGLATIVVGPLSGRAADRQGVRSLTISGLALTSLGMLAFYFVDHTAPFWWLVVLMLISGISASLFMSPNSKSVMNAAPPQRRGIASGTRMMLQNVGSMVSMAIAMPMVLTGLSATDMAALFIYGGGISPAALRTFEDGLHQAFLLFFLVSLVALAISLVRVRPAKLTESGPMVRYRKILVPTDGSDKTGPAVTYALGLAKVMGADVSAMYVIDDSGYDYAGSAAAPEVESIKYEQGASAVDSLALQGKPYGLDVRTLISSGIPASKIIEASTDQDLIVMGTAGRTGVSHLLLGSVAERVVRSAHSPVLVVPSGSRTVDDLPRVKKLLIPTDGSENTRPAIEHGLAVAKLFGAEVTAMSVISPDASPSPPTGKDEGREVASAATRQISDEAKRYGLTVNVSIVTGVPSDEIIKASEDHDLVVMGTVGRTGLAHIRLGSVAERTVRQAHCPVLVVRSREAKGTG